MESLERKDASTGPEEPIKSEGIVPSPDTNSERSNGATSPPPNCSICLGHLVNTSFTDSCLHQFCFNCLLQWSKIKTECPLCKQTFKSIIHNVRSEGDYDQYPVHMYAHQVAATLDVTADIHISGQWDVAVGVGVPVRPFMYRTTMGANRRYGMLLNPEAVANREQIPSIAPQISVEERRRRNANPIDYRRTVYRHGIWAASLPDAFGRYRESSAEYYRRHPSEVNRLVPWLNRELQVLLNNNRPQIAYVMGVITDILVQYDIRSVEFRNVIRTYFGIHTDHFVHELSNYARTNFDLVGYDQHVTYLPNRGLSNEYVQRAVSPTPSTSSSSSTDSEVRVLNDNIFDFPRLNAYHMPSAGPHIMDMPGPSTVGHAFRLLPSYTEPDVLTISDTSSSSENECEVIGYVKPRHERTPEIIDLSSSEVEEVNTASQSTSNDNAPLVNAAPLKDEEQPSTSTCCDNADSRRSRRQAEDAFRAQMLEYLDSTSESDSEENDSDYKPASSKTRRYKSTSKKVSTKSTRKLRSRKRKKTTLTLRKRNKETRNRLYSSDDSDNESPDWELNTSRGTKRAYHSMSSDVSEPEKATKKNKKSKKSKTPKKSKKRNTVSSSSSKNICHYSSTDSSCSACNSDTEPESNKNTRRRKKKSYHYLSEETSANEKSSQKSSRSRSSSSRRTSSRRRSSKFSKDLFEYQRSGSSRRSSNSSFDSHPAERLQELQEDSSNHDANRRFTSDEEEDKSHDQRSSSPFSDVVSSSYQNQESQESEDKSAAAVTTATTTTGQTSSQSSERLSASSSSSASSSKNDASTRTEHSESSKTSKDRRRSHKKRKDLKKRRRSRS